MSKIHPILILAVLSFIVLGLYFKKEFMVEQYEQEMHTVALLEEEIKGLVLIKEKWTQSPNKLKAIVTNPAFSGITIKEESIKNKVLIKIDGMSAHQFDAFMTKLLNSYIIISRLEILKNDSLISISVEIEK